MAKYSMEYNKKGIPADDQPELCRKAGIAFYMELKFSTDIGNTDLDELLTSCGFTEKPVLKNAQTITLKQTVNFLPDEKIIREYEKVLTEAHPDYRNVRFTGFGTVRMVPAVYTETAE